jgi:uncharacterized protein (TIGR01244 family)
MSGNVMRVVRGIAVGVGIFLSLAAHAGSDAPEVTNLGAWGAAEHVMASGQFYISDQPDTATFDVARREGVVAVINIRGAKEIDWDEASAVSAAGLSYHNVPFIANKDGIGAVSVQNIRQVVNDLDGGKVLLHCASGNRAAAWWALYLVEDLGVDEVAAVQAADKAGLTNPALRGMVEKYFIGAQ